jgi:hypothetical protein
MWGRWRGGRVMKMEVDRGSVGGSRWGKGEEG